MDKLTRIALLVTAYVHDAPDVRWTASGLYRKLASRDRPLFVKAAAAAARRGWLVIADDGDVRPGTRPDSYLRSVPRGSLVDQVRAELTK